MTGDELRRRIDRLGLTYTDGARQLGLSLSGLNHKMRGERPVGQQTEIILDLLGTSRAGEAGEVGHSPTAPAAQPKEDAPCKPAPETPRKLTDRAKRYSCSVPNGPSEKWR
jgi:transcriptional regulator with XRE-family HTH domain